MSTSELNVAEFKVIGTRPVRHDGVDKVTGRAVYGADYTPTGSLYGRVLRSPYAHARILRIDVAPALAMDGVEAVVTADDFPDPGNRIAELGEGAINLAHLSANCLARGKVLYHGHAVAAVAAVSPHIAEEAVRRIVVEYERLPHVTDVQAAMLPNAPLLHDNLHTESLGQTSEQPSNVAKHIQFQMGNVEEGFQRAAAIVEREFHTATVHQGYIEPHNGTALWNADGTLTVWCSTQGAFTVRQQVAELLDIPLSRVKVVPLEIGGGFGGKIRVYLEPVAALLSRKTGLPVKMSMDRAEVFLGTGPTPASYIRVKMGADAQGRLTAATAYLAYEAGAFPGSPVGPGAMCVFACYDIPNVHVDGYDVVVNKPCTSAYRAPGATNAAFASETVIDELCRKLQIDPLEFRLRNGAREGTRRADGPTYPRIGMIESVDAARRHPHYQTPLTGRHQGRGVASGFWFNCGLKSSATASVNSDGSVGLVEGSTDIGGSRTSIAMQLAEALGIPVQDVRPSVGDTDSVGYTDVTGGSRVTFATGWAAYEAAQDIKRQMVQRAAMIWGVDAGQITYENGGVVCGERRMTFRELAGQMLSTGGGIVGRATVDPPGAGGGFATHICDVEVDTDTGKVKILRYTAVQDVGRAIHPSYVEGQMQGGAVQGIGWALNEEYFYNERGELVNASFLDYRMPTSLDLPMIDTVLVEVPNPGHPYGVRGVGEVPIVPPPAAIANAIAAATGVRLDRLPMNPCQVLKALHAQGSRS
ncbi:MAG: xanthine dehydrogenase family protein molybdopterin-binding subunit [Pirellulaceae bacterium]